MPMEHIPSSITVRNTIGLHFIILMRAGIHLENLSVDAADDRTEMSGENNTAGWVF